MIKKLIFFSKTEVMDLFDCIEIITTRNMPSIWLFHLKWHFLAEPKELTKDNMMVSIRNIINWRRILMRKETKTINKKTFSYSEMDCFISFKQWNWRLCNILLPFKLLLNFPPISRLSTYHISSICTQSCFLLHYLIACSRSFLCK